MNSTELLRVMKQLSEKAGTNIDIDIEQLAALLGINITALISVITELENRDQIMVNITTTSNNDTNQAEYAGTVRLMDTPPDEAANI